MVDILLGLQWGDEGKGKVIDFLAPQYDMVARYQGGPNAGHTLYINEQKFVLHTVPSGIFHGNIKNLIGNGVVIDPIILKKEIENLNLLGVDVKNNLFISKKAHLILPTHRILDSASEASKGLEKIGSTLKGIGPTYMDKTGRNGLRTGEILSVNFKNKYQILKNKHEKLLHLYQFDYDIVFLEKEWFESIEFLMDFNFVDSEYLINEEIKKGKKVLAEGAQGAMLDIDFGTYPYVTSSSTISAGACIGLGISPKNIGEVIGISKAYCTRVGSGPFPTELMDEPGERLRNIGREFGATTGRPRRCGWIDLPALKYAIMINGVSQIVITKADVLNEFETINICTHYELNGKKVSLVPFDIDRQNITPVYKTFNGWQQSLETIHSFDELPQTLKEYLKFIESELETKITMLSTGPQREKLITGEMTPAY